MCVVVSEDESDTMMPSFGLIKDIFITDENHSFVICEMYETIYFDDHFQAFNVVKTNNLICLSLEKLGSISYSCRSYIWTNIHTNKIKYVCCIFVSFLYLFVRNIINVPMYTKTL